ncbi:hypothetical protein T492DRAFT_966182, partial [Pavlovales sp. CCMP2436]
MAAPRSRGNTNTQSMSRLALVLACAAGVDGARLAVRIGRPSVAVAPRRARPMAAATAGGGERPLRVAIAGGGVGGLTTALCLLKKGFDVTVYEKTDAFKRFGGPIQFASNALSTLYAIDPVLFELVTSKFTYTGTRACGIKDGLRAKGFAMGGDKLSYLWDSSVGADWYVRFPLKECAELWNLPYTGVIDRPDLQDILLDACRAIKPDVLRNGDEVIGYDQAADGEVTVKFSSGAAAGADVLVGADGIWSAVRGQMYGETRGEMKKGGKERQGCTYSGYTVFAGETIISLPDYYETGYKVYIGPKRYFVTSDVGNGRVQWYAFFATEPGMKLAKSGWGSESAVGSADASVIGYLKGLHAGWSEEVHTVLDATPESAVEQRDLYDRRPELLRSWSDKGLASATAESAATDANGAALPLAPRKERVHAALQEYYKTRIVRTASVQVLSRLASDLIINLFDTPWSPHDKKGTDWKSYLTFFWKPVLQYLVFPAQFAYLYSFRPSGPMADLPAQLADAWKARHRADAEAAFAHAREIGRDGLAAESAAKGSFLAER